MKKFISLLILLLFLLSNPISVFADTEGVSFGVDSGYPPFSYLVNEEAAGFEIDLIKALFSTGEYSLEMKFGYTWDDIYKQTMSGGLDICGTIVKTEKRATEVLFTNDAYTRYYGVFTSSNTIDLDLAHLETIKLGAVKGYYSEIIVKEELMAEQYVIYDSYDEMIQGLIQNKIDAFIESTEVVNYYINKYNLIGQVILQKDGLFPTSVPFGVTKSRPDLVDFMNNRLKALQNSGEYEILYMKNFSSHSPFYYEQQKRTMWFILFGLVASIILVLSLLQIYIRFLRKRILRAQGFSKAIVENATVAIILWHPDDGIVSYNPFAHYLLGYDEIEVLGNQGIENFFNTKEEKIEFQNWLQDMKKDAPLNFNVKCKDGHQLTLLCSRKDIDNPDKSNGLVAIFGTDITEVSESQRRLSQSYKDLEENAAELEEMNNELESKNIQLNQEVTIRKAIELDLITSKEDAETANKAKGYFLANMSHEIRTPMNGFMGMIQLLNMTSPSEEQAEYLRLSQVSADALLIVVNEIMDYTKIEAGRMLLEEKDFNLRQVIKEMNDLFKPSAITKGLMIDVIIDKDLPEIMNGDAFKLKQVLSNLIGNAVKFTASGSILIAVTMDAMKSQDKLGLRFQIKDTGIGIPKDKVDILFSRFTQIDSSHSRVYGGTGLGLAISKGIVELMGGDIWIESVENEGSSFFFTCIVNHRHTVDQPHLVVKPSSEENRSLSQLNILLVEDDMTNQIVIKKLFAKKGWTLSIAENGKIAVDLIAITDFDLILMDCQMPIMDGYEATRIIREMEKNLKHSIIIAMTAHTLPADLQKCLNAGMDGYISKPYNFDQMINTIIQATNK